MARAKVRALVVDDSTAARAVIGAMLEELDVDVVDVDGAARGLALLRASVGDGAAVVDVALVDWNMPEMDGLELVRAVRAERSLDGVKLMMVTTETEQQRVAAALEAGADEYVMKPFDRDVIRDKLLLLGLPVRAAAADAGAGDDNDNDNDDVGAADAGAPDAGAPDGQP